MGQGSAKNLASISGVTVTGTPSTGQVLTATSAAAADWQTPVPAIQSGRTTLVNGTSPSISVPFLGTNSRIVCTMAALNSSTAIGFLRVDESTRTPGAPGTFVITSLNAALSVEAGDQSDIDWVVAP